MKISCRQLNENLQPSAYEAAILLILPCATRSDTNEQLKVDCVFPVLFILTYTTWWMFQMVLSCIAFCQHLTDSKRLYIGQTAKQIIYGHSTRQNTLLYFQLGIGKCKSTGKA